MKGRDMSIFPTRILLATDGSEDAELASATASDLAASTGSTLHVVTVGGKPPDSAYYNLGGPTYEEVLEVVEREAWAILDAQVERIKAGGGKVQQIYVRTGDRAQEIVALSEQLGVGLIVMGSRGRGGISKALMGSVSDSVVRHAHCPVMIVRE